MSNKALKTASSSKSVLTAGFFEELGFYETSPRPLYKLPLPTTGTYLLATNDGSLWILRVLMKSGGKVLELGDLQNRVLLLLFRFFKLLNNEHDLPMCRNW